nr:hypothetical protein [Tanacetum cinerariifolium]
MKCYSKKTMISGSCRLLWAVVVSLLFVIIVNGAEGLPKYVSSGEGVEVYDFNNRSVERSYVPTKRSEYMDEEKFLQKSIKLP